MIRANLIKEYTSQKGEETYIYEIVGLTDSQIQLYKKYRKANKHKVYLTTEEDTVASDSNPNPALGVGNPKHFTEFIYPDIDTVIAGVIRAGDDAGRIWLKCAIEKKAIKYSQARELDFAQAFSFLAGIWKKKHNIQPTVSAESLLEEDDDDDAFPFPE